MAIWFLTLNKSLRSLQNQQMVPLIHCIEAAKSFDHANESPEQEIRIKFSAYFRFQCLALFNLKEIHFVTSIEFHCFSVNITGYEILLRHFVVAYLSSSSSSIFLSILKWENKFRPIITPTLLNNLPKMISFNTLRSRKHILA